MKWIAIVLVFACGKGSSDNATSSAGSARSGSEDCKVVPMCATFPAAKVDAMCGSKTVSTNPIDQSPQQQITIDSCEYNNAKRESEVTIGRMCIPGSIGGAATAKQMFEGDMAKKGENDIQSDRPGLGDEAYYRVSGNHTQAQLWVRKGNLIISTQNTTVTAQTEAAVEKQCLLALYNEVVAK